MIVINFKNYKNGSEALRLVGKIEKHLPDAVVALNAFDLSHVAFYHSRMQIFAQHVDFVEGNRATGYLSARSLKSHGGKGSLLNHSEHRLEFSVIRKTVEQMKKEKLKVILCAKDLKEGRKFIFLKPDAIAFEDTKLIGSGKSITKYKSGDVAKFAEMLRGTKIAALCGAGVSTAEYVLAARKLGCKGVLIASAIADVPDEKVEELLGEISQVKL